MKLREKFKNGEFWREVEPTVTGLLLVLVYSVICYMLVNGIVAYIHANS